jgi:hypothetical protein
MNKDGTNKYDDSETGGYSYAEKLALVAQGLMDPTSIGLPPGDAGHKLALDELTGEEKPTPKLADYVTFEASTVPIELRAHWARQDLKVVPTGVTAREWEANWIAEHKNEFTIQATLHSGYLMSQVGQTFTDPILGFCELMRKAADLLEAKYNELKQTDPSPIVFRTDKSAKAPAKTDQPDQQQKA